MTKYFLESCGALSRKQHRKRILSLTQFKKKCFRIFSPVHVFNGGVLSWPFKFKTVFFLFFF